MTFCFFLKEPGQCLKLLTKLCPTTNTKKTQLFKEIVRTKILFLDVIAIKIHSRLFIYVLKMHS